jgi:hypothetical protein
MAGSSSEGSAKSQPAAPSQGPSKVTQPSAPTAQNAPSVADPRAIPENPNNKLKTNERNEQGLISQNKDDNEKREKDKSGKEKDGEAVEETVEELKNKVEDLQKTVENLTKALQGMQPSRASEPDIDSQGNGNDAALQALLERVMRELEQNRKNLDKRETPKNQAAANNARTSGGGKQDVQGEQNSVEGPAATGKLGEGLEQRLNALSGGDPSKKNVLEALQKATQENPDKPLEWNGKEWKEPAERAGSYNLMGQLHSTPDGKGAVQISSSDRIANNPSMPMMYHPQQALKAANAEQFVDSPAKVFMQLDKNGKVSKAAVETKNSVQARSVTSPTRSSVASH